MFRFIFVLVILGAFYEICCFETQTEDWRKQGFYRPRRNYPTQNNSFQAYQNQYTLSQNSFRSNGPSSTGANNQNAISQNLFGNSNWNSQTPSNFRSYNQHQKFANQNTESPSQQSFSFGAYRNAPENELRSQNAFPSGNQQTTQSSFLSRFGQNTFASSFSQNPGLSNAQKSFTNSQTQYSQKQNSFGSSNNQEPQNYFRNSEQNSFGSYQNLNTFQLHNASPRFSNYGSNSFTRNQSFKGADYLPPTRFKAPEYLPPNPKTTIPPFIPFTTTTRPFYTTTTRKPNTTTKRPFFTTPTTTRRPLYTTTTRKPITTTKRPFFTTPTTTRRPFYTTTTRKPITTTKRPFFTTPTTTRRPLFTTTTTKIPSFTTSTTPLYTTTTKNPTTTRKSPRPFPAQGMKVPPEPEDNGDKEPDGMILPQFAPAQAMKVPPEPEDDGDEIIPVTRTTTTSTTPPTTTTTTPSTTTSTTSPTTMITRTPSTTTTTTPSTTTSTMAATTTTTTTPSTTTSTTPPSNPSTTTSTTPPTTTTTSTTTPSTTTSTTPPTTTTTTTTPPPTTTTTPATTTTTNAPSTSTTTPDPNRNLIEDTSTPILTTSTTSTTTIKPPVTDPYKAPEYLPPNDTSPIPPSPALAIPVPPEPECDPLDPKGLVPLNIEIRTLGNPCEPGPTTSTVKPPFRGPLYLPPDPKIRVGRSSNVTLKLEDLNGMYRPVWYAGIYRKTTDPYLPICGGSIIREDVVLSAAHCFWDDAVGKQPASLFAVAARKLYKPWKEPKDKRAQKSDVLDIKIPPRFLGAKTSFQEDLAILKLATPFTYNQGLRPICVDFDDDFDRQQMKDGHLGTIAGWGYTDAAGTPTQRLLWLELPYVEIEKCIRDSEDSFLKYITCDKVCAGENDTGKALCRGDSGGGLAFWSGPARHATPFLRGVASTAPARRNAECNVFAYASFTHVRAHRTFLRDHVLDIEKCRFWE